MCAIRMMLSCIEHAQEELASATATHMYGKRVKNLKSEMYVTEMVKRCV